MYRQLHTPSSCYSLLWLPFEAGVNSQALRVRSTPLPHAGPSEMSALVVTQLAAGVAGRSDGLEAELVCG